MTGHNRFREGLESGRFVVSFESVPGRGAREYAQEELLEGLANVWADERVDVITCADSPSGRPALPSSAFARDLQACGIDTIAFLTCKDRSRNGLESELFSLARAGVENLLCMTGDYPTQAWRGASRAVYDLDSVSLLTLAREMGEGLRYPGPRGIERQLKPAGFFCGCVASPFKATQAERDLQLWKLLRKQEAGAQFCILQIGYDAAAQGDFLAAARAAGVTIPVLANVYVMGRGIGRVMAAGRIPGCHASPRLVRDLEREYDSDDRGREASYIRAAKMVAVARGQGFSGVHLAGLSASAKVVAHVLDMADGYRDGWEECAAEVSYGFEAEELAGLEVIDDVPTRRGKEAAEAILPGIAEQVAVQEGPTLESLLDLWPVADCPKIQRVGPCGGSHCGWCEVQHDRPCIWYEAYERLAAEGRGRERELGRTSSNPLVWG